MRVLLLTQWFQPEPALKGLPFATALAHRGHEVHVLTGFPNYPGGRVYPGYHVRPVQREMMDGISVLRVPLFPSHDRSAVRRSANYLSFMASASTLGACLLPSVDVAYAYHPPLTVGLAATALRLLRGVPFVFDVQDLWPDTVVATGMLPRGPMVAALDVACRVVYRQAARIVVLSPGFKTALVERRVPAEKVDVVYNWCDEASLVDTQPEPATADALGMAGRFNVVFAGTMGLAQGLETVLETAALLACRAPTVQFVLLGGGVQVERLRQQAEAMGLGNVLFLPQRSQAEAAKVLALADALLVHLRDDPLFAITIPSKTQAYLAIGKPIIMAVRGDAADLVRKAGAGLTCAPGSAPEMARAVETLLEMSGEMRDSMGASGRGYYRRELSLDVGVSRLERLLAVAAKGEAAAP
jgi:colanic acid biosynthesis glycosyl transferase WcaI